MNSPLHLIFESSAFPPVPGEDDETNAGIYGIALVAWLADQLGRAGYVVKRLVAEDYGRLVEVAHPDCKLYAAVSSTDDTALKWRVFAFSEFGFLAKLKGSPEGARAVSTLINDLKRILGGNPAIKALREEAA